MSSQIQNARSDALLPIFAALVISLASVLESRVVGVTLIAVCLLSFYATYASARIRIALMVATGLAALASFAPEAMLGIGPLPPPFQEGDIDKLSQTTQSHLRLVMVLEVAVIGVMLASAIVVALGQRAGAILGRLALPLFASAIVASPLVLRYGDAAERDAMLVQFTAKKAQDLRISNQAANNAQTEQNLVMTPTISPQAAEIADSVADSQVDISTAALDVQDDVDNAATIRQDLKVQYCRDANEIIDKLFDTPRHIVNPIGQLIELQGAERSAFCERISISISAQPKCLATGRAGAEIESVCADNDGTVRRPNHVTKGVADLIATTLSAQIESCALQRAVVLASECDWDTFPCRRNAAAGEVIPMRQPYFVREKREPSKVMECDDEIYLSLLRVTSGDSQRPGALGTKLAEDLNGLNNSQ